MALDPVNPARPSAISSKKRGFCSKSRHLRRRGTSLCLESAMIEA